jgi:hypothetical protein
MAERLTLSFSSQETVGRGQRAARRRAGVRARLPRRANRERRRRGETRDTKVVRAFAFANCKNRNPRRAVHHRDHGREQLVFEQSQGPGERRGHDARGGGANRESDRARRGVFGVPEVEAVAIPVPTVFRVSLRLRVVGGFVSCRVAASEKVGPAAGGKRKRTDRRTRHGTAKRRGESFPLEK